MSQVPAQPTTAWLLDLTAARGPRVVVLRRDEAQARAALVEQLIAMGTVSAAREAEDLLTDVVGEPVGVIW